MPEKTASCVTCGSDFTITEAEQTFLKEKGLDDPQDCPDCRKAKKATRRERGRQQSYGIACGVSAGFSPALKLNSS